MTIRHTFAPLAGPRADLRGCTAAHHFGDARTSAEVSADIAAAQQRRRTTGFPPPDHEANGLRVSAQLGYHAEAIRHFYRMAEAVALADAARRAGS